MKKSTYFRLEDKKGKGYPTVLGRFWGTSKWNSNIDKAEKALDDDMVVPEGVKHNDKFAFTPAYVKKHGKDIKNLIGESKKIGVELKLNKISIPMSRISWGDKDQIIYRGINNGSKKQTNKK